MASHRMQLNYEADDSVQASHTLTLTLVNSVARGTTTARECVLRPTKPVVDARCAIMAAILAD